MAKDNSDIHDLALKQYGRIWSAIEGERKIAISDRRFVGVTGAQWEGALGVAYANKVKVEVDKTSLAVERVDNEYRAQRLTVDFTSTDGSENDDLADVCDGLYRADEQASGAQEAYDGAFNEGITGGYGAWRFTAEWEDELDDENEYQRIKIEPIYEADKTVFFDLNSKRQDKSDARYCFVVEALTRESYENEYDDDPTSWPVDTETAQFDWFTVDSVYVAEYYKVGTVEVELSVYRDVGGEETTYSNEDFSRDETLAEMLIATGSTKVRSRRVKRKQVTKCIMSGGGLLSEPEVIPGPNIPVVPYYGRRVFIDGQERCSGIVRRAKDAQRLKNMMLSKLAEQSAQSAYPKPIFAPEQMTPAISAAWGTANVDNPAYMQAEPIRDQSGNIQHTGPLGYTQAGDIPPATAALTTLVDTDLTQVLGNQQAGEEIHSNVSGKAVELVQDRLDQQSFKYMDNFRISMQRGGEIWLGMARELYVEDGRKMKTVGSQKEVGSVVLSEKIVSEDGEVVSRGDLSRANFEVMASVGPSSSSKRQSMVRTLGGILQNTKDQQTATIMEAAIIQNVEGEGMSEINEFFRKKLVGLGVYEPTEQDEKEAEEAAQQKQPDANEEFLRSEAAKNMAAIEKSGADTQQSLAKADNLQADTATKLASIPRDDRQQLIDAAGEIDREGGRRGPDPTNDIGLSNGFPPGQ